MGKLLYMIILLPLCGFILNGLVGKKIQKYIVGVIASTAVFISFCLTLCLINYFWANETPIYYNILQWIKLEHFNIQLSLYVDRLSVWMMGIITGVGFLIHLYSMGYMIKDEGYYKFFSFLNLFIFFMLILVMGSSLVTTFIGWEGVGLCSYFLIGFWYQNKSYSAAAMKAFVMNRIGDLGFLIAIFLCFQHFGSTEYSNILQNASQVDGQIGFWICFCLFIGAVGKSAQLPLFTWLPDAMAGPTPVSALIHAATMVTAGIYLCVRTNVLFIHHHSILVIVLSVAIITSIIGAVIALRQNDIKKVLAYSTVSQLGLMFIAIGVGAFDAAIFHLTTHAFFKALLFLGAGSVIHAMSGEQDIRKMGGLKKMIPTTYWTFLIGVLAIIGFPLMSGFFSKDEILASSFAYSKLVWIISMIISMLTGIYMLRMFFLTFHGDFRGTDAQKHHLHESPAIMTVPLIILAILSLFGGMLNVPILFNGNRFLHFWLTPVLNPGFHEHTLSHNVEWSLLAITVLMVLIIIIIMNQKYVIKNKLAKEDINLSKIEKILNKKLYFDEYYNAIFVEPIQFLSKTFHEFIEKRILNKSIDSLGQITTQLGKISRKIQNGNLEIYLLGMVVGIILLLVFSFWM